MTIAERPGFPDRIRAAMAALRGDDLAKASLASQAVSTTGLVELARQLSAGNEVIPFGPGTPIAPTLPEEVEPRRYDYPIGQNIATSPRAYEPITFAVLRQLARNYDVAQLAIQKRIDGIRRLTWAVRPKPVPGMTRAEAKTREARLEDDIAAVTGFLTKPDQEHEFPDWMSRWLYDVFTIDAATIYLRPTLAGELYGLEIIDGATIRPIIDGYGRPPAPPMPAYAQVIKGMTREFLSRDQIIYAPYWARSDSLYGHPPLEWVLLAVNRALRRQTLDLSNFTEGTLPVAFLKVAADMPAAQVKELKLYLDELLAGNDVARSRVIPIPGGTGTGLDAIHPMPETAAEEFLMHITCAAIGVSPTELGFVAPGSGLGGKGFAELQHSSSSERNAGLARHIGAKLDSVIATDPPFGLGKPELALFWDNLDEKGDRLAEAQAMKEYWSMGATTSDWIAENVLDQDAPGLGPVIAFGGTVTTVADLLAPPEPVPTALAPSAGPSGPGGPPPETPNAAAGETTDTESMGAVQKAAGSDLDRWQRKALRAVKEGRDPTRFESDEIPATQADAIREALAKASSPDDVRAAFSHPAPLSKAKAEHGMKSLYADWFHEQGTDLAERIGSLAKSSGAEPITRRARPLSEMFAAMAAEDEATDERLAKAAAATEERFVALTQTFAEGIDRIASRPVNVTVPAPIVPEGAVQVTVQPTPVILPPPPPPVRRRVDRDPDGHILSITEEPLNG